MEAGENLLKLFPLVREELIGERQAAEAPTARTAEELLKIYCSTFLITAVILPRTALTSFSCCHNSFCKGWLESVEVSGKISIEST